MAQELLETITAMSVNNEINEGSYKKIADQMKKCFPKFPVETIRVKVYGILTSLVETQVFDKEEDSDDFMGIKLKSDVITKYVDIPKDSFRIIKMKLEGVDSVKYSNLPKNIKEMFETQEISYKFKNEDKCFVTKHTSRIWNNIEKNDDIDYDSDEQEYMSHLLAPDTS